MDDTVASYDEWHDHRERLDDDGGPGAPWHLLTIAHLPEVRGKKVLEIGCGRGVFAQYLAEQGRDL